MSRQFTYKDSFRDERKMRRYADHQLRYRKHIRESDKFLIQLVRLVVGKRNPLVFRLLDIGCSTGNFLYHLKKSLPDLDLSGGDLSKLAVKQCQCDQMLEGIDFRVMNILELKARNAYDIIVANATFAVLNPHEFQRAARSVGKALRSGGTCIIFDWFHPFRQDLAIEEYTKRFPKGIKIYFRSYHFVREAFAAAGFHRLKFQPFSIPISLPKMEQGEIHSYTVRTRDGQNLSFRGALFQPWCFLTAVKKG